MAALLRHAPGIPVSRLRVARGHVWKLADPLEDLRRGRPSPAPEPVAVSGDPFGRGHPATPRFMRSGSGDALCPAGPSVLLLRARRLLFWAPRARRLRRAWNKTRLARRQGPAGASDPGHQAIPACGRGAQCLLVKLAGRSPFIRQGSECGRRTGVTSPHGDHTPNTARRRCWLRPAEVAGWAALPSGHGSASRNPASARAGSSIPLQSLSHRLCKQAGAPCGCGCPSRTFLVAVTAHPAPSGAGAADLGSAGDG